MVNRKVNEVDRIERWKKIGAVVVVTENITCCPDKTEWPGICLMFVFATSLLNALPTVQYTMNESLWKAGLLAKRNTTKPMPKPTGTLRTTY